MFGILKKSFYSYSRIQNLQWQANNFGFADIFDAAVLEWNAGG